MKILTSYFYQIRNFKRNMIPLSTAVSDPKWFHCGRGRTFVFKDSNGVYNGIRAEPFVPQCSWGDCAGAKFCSYKPEKCNFLSNYYKQLQELDFNEIMQRFSSLAERIVARDSLIEEPIMVLIFYEPPDNPCSERRIVQKWFKENGYIIDEY